jgi:hypothetical protein
MHVKRQGFFLRDIAGRKLHHENGGFVNPFVPCNRYALWRISQIVYWKLFTKNRYKNVYVNERAVPVTVDWSAATRTNSLSITWLKHATLFRACSQILLSNGAYKKQRDFLTCLYG